MDTGILSYVPRRWKDKSFFFSCISFLHPPNPPKSLRPAKGLTSQFLQQRVKFGGRKAQQIKASVQQLFSHSSRSETVCYMLPASVILRDLQEACSGVAKNYIPPIKVNIKSKAIRYHGKPNEFIKLPICVGENQHKSHAIKSECDFQNDFTNTCVVKWS